MNRVLAVICSVVAVVGLTGADWLQFRGPNGTGAVNDDKVPTTWSEDQNIAWKASLPGRGLSSPIVVGHRVVVTACTGYRQDKLHVVCFDSRTGEKLWARQFWATGRTMTHQSISTAAPSPVSDGESIFATFSTNDVVALDLKGNLKWIRGLTHDYPNASNSLGMASSPIAVKDTLVVQLETDSQSLAVGINTSTGKNRWKLKRPKRANWSSPTTLRDPQSGEELVLLQSSEGISAIKPVTGEERWFYNQGASTIPSSVVTGDIVLVPSHGLTALKHSPDSTGPEILWQENRLGPGTSSPLVHEGRVYTVSKVGVIKCADVKTGKLVWQLRIKGKFSGTPVAAGNHLYFFNEDGLGQVVSLSGKARLVAAPDLAEAILCTPAISDGAMYVRSDSHLWKIAKTN